MGRRSHRIRRIVCTVTVQLSLNPTHRLYGHGTALLESDASFVRSRHRLPSKSEGYFQPTFYRDVLENPHGQLADKSKGYFQPTFCRDVVATTTQSLKVSQNRVFDVSRDPQTTEMTTSPKILSIFHCSDHYESVAAWGRQRQSLSSGVTTEFSISRVSTRLAPINLYDFGLFTTINTFLQIHICKIANNVIEILKITINLRT